ncbi:MAG: domain containing protein [Blastococcus sp.]|nr:domain containing protein [Blastococcus sp.]
MTTEHMEIERKFEAGPEFVLPDLTTVPGVACVGEPEEHELEATYYDTPDLRLLRSKVTLRRRTGGPDAGWHVKLPAGAGARRELHQPLGPAVESVPQPVLEPVLGILGTGSPVPVATVHTHRLVRRLVDADGRALAEVADDAVTGAALPAEAGQAATVVTWREIEVELADGDEGLLDAVGCLLVEAGARVSGSASKVGRILADRLAALGNQPSAGEDSGRRKPGGQQARRGRGPTAGELVLAAVAERIGDLRSADVAVRTGQPDGVHDFRVACRRLRSIFAAFRPVLAREHTDPVRAELQWVGRELSGTRDGEVALEHLRALVAEQPPELVLGPVAARLQQTELKEHLRGAEHAVQVLSDPRYLRLVDALNDLLARPPVTELAEAPAKPIALRAVRTSGKRLRRAVRAADRASGQARHTALHETRKAAKRVRYTAEVALAVLGRPAKKLMRAMKKVQKVLGHAQDTVITRQYCIRLGLAAAAAGENAWTYGRLHALEEARAERAEQQFWTRWPRIRAVLKAATS